MFGAPFKRMCSLVDLFTPKFSEIEKGFSLYVMKLWTDFAKFGLVRTSQSSFVLFLSRKMENNGPH